MTERRYTGGSQPQGNLDISDIYKGLYPIGSIMIHTSNTIPDGWARCDGSSLNSSNYSELFSVVGYNFGGSGSSFNLPDLRGRFLRFADNMGTGSRGVDSGRQVGSTQSDTYQSHNHSLTGSIGSSGSSHTHYRSSSGSGNAEHQHEFPVVIGVDILLNEFTPSCDGGYSRFRLTGRDGSRYTKNVNGNGAHSHNSISITSVGSDSYSLGHSHGNTFSNTSYVGSTETRPRNKSFHIIIRIY